MEDLDDWDDWTGVGAAGSSGGRLSQQVLSHAALTGALVDSSSSTNTPSVGEAARAAAAAAREGLSSVADIFSGGFSHDEFNGGGASTFGGQSPELVRARNALIAFREDMKESGVEYSLQCASALLQTLGSLSEYTTMMQFLRNPPPGVEPDVKMYNHALYALAQAPSHWQKGGGAGTSRHAVPTGPVAALALADEMQIMVWVCFPFGGGGGSGGVDTG